MLIVVTQDAEIAYMDDKISSPPKELLDNLKGLYDGKSFVMLNYDVSFKQLKKENKSVVVTKELGEYIVKLVDNPLIFKEPTEIELLQKENQLLKAQNNALSERADFIEDVVAEMAIQVYQ